MPNGSNSHDCDEQQPDERGVSDKIKILRRRLLQSAGAAAVAGLGTAPGNAVAQQDYSPVSLSNGNFRFNFYPELDRNYITSIEHKGHDFEDQYLTFAGPVHYFPRDGTDDGTNRYHPEEIRSFTSDDDSYSITRRYVNSDGLALDITASSRLPAGKRALLVDLTYTNPGNEPFEDATLTVDTPSNFVADGTLVGPAHIQNPSGKYRFHVSGGSTKQFADVSQWTHYEPSGDIPFVTAFDDLHALTVGLLEGDTDVEMGFINQGTDHIRLHIKEFTLEPEESKQWTVAIGAHLGGDDAPQTAKTVMENAAEQARTPPKPDLFIERMRPVQVTGVFPKNPKNPFGPKDPRPDANNDGILDLVQNKATAVLVYPGGTDLGTAGKNIERHLEESASGVTLQVEVLRRDKEAEKVEGTSETTISPDKYQEKVNTGFPDGYIDLPVEVPNTGKRAVRVTVDPNDKISEKGCIDPNCNFTGEMNNSFQQTVNVLSTDPMQLSYVRVDDGDVGIPSGVEFTELFQKSNEFVKATFPVANSDYFTRLHESKLDISEASPKTNPLFIIMKALAALDNLAYLEFLERDIESHDPPRGIGVVTSDFFNKALFSKEDTSGITHMWLNSVLVEVGAWKTTAHELGHQLGLHREKEEYNIAGTDIGSGYWVNRSELIKGRIAFMESSASKRDISSHWLSNVKGGNTRRKEDFRDFDEMFRTKLPESRQTTTTKVVNENKEDIIYLRGLVSDGGTLNTSTLDFYTKGPVFSTADGDAAFVGRDVDGEVVIERSFELTFRLGVLESPLETDSAPFSFPMRYPSDVRTLEIQHAGDTVTTFQTTSKLLHDAIARVPDTGFKQPGKGDTDVATERRQALQNKVDAIEQMLEAGNEQGKGTEQGTRRKLENDLRPAVERWLKDDYETPTFDDISKEHLLTIIDRHIERMG